MNHKLLPIVALCATMAACNSKTETALPTSVVLPGTVDNEAFVSNVESISVMNLQMDDKWSISGKQKLAFGDNYTYLFVTREFELLCFDNKAGEIISGRAIRGNGPGEITFLYSMFCIGDTLCIYDSRRVLGQYNQNCAFLGRTCELDESFMGYNLFRLGNGDYAMVNPSSFSSDTTPALLLTDNQFNVKSKHFTAPQTSIFVFSGAAPTYYSNNDTVRLFIMFDDHLYTVYGDTEQSLEFVLSNSLTSQKASDLMDSDNFNPYDYDGNYSGLGESGRFITFQYRCDKMRYSLLLDKRTHNVVSINLDEDLEDSAVGFIIKLIKNAEVFQTDAKYLYAGCKNSKLAEILEGHDDLLDARLKKTQAEYRAFLERNADYIKGLEPDERDAATVLLKIKLKD